MKKNIADVKDKEMRLYARIVGDSRKQMRTETEMTMKGLLCHWVSTAGGTLGSPDSFLKEFHFPVHSLEFLV